MNSLYGNTWFAFRMNERTNGLREMDETMSISEAWRQLKWNQDFSTGISIAKYYFGMLQTRLMNMSSPHLSNEINQRMDIHENVSSLLINQMLVYYCFYLRSIFQCNEIFLWIAPAGIMPANYAEKSFSHLLSRVGPWSSCFTFVVRRAFIPSPEQYCSFPFVHQRAETMLRIAAMLLLNGSSINLLVIFLNKLFKLCRERTESIALYSCYRRDTAVK